MTNWTEIHPDFTEELQAEWENRGFNDKETQAWISIGFEPNNLKYVIHWKNLNFTASEAQGWINIGLNTKDHQLAYYCQTKGLTSEIVKDNLEQYRRELKEKLEGELKSLAYVEEKVGLIIDTPEGIQRGSSGRSGLVNYNDYARNFPKRIHPNTGKRLIESINNYQIFLKENKQVKSPTKLYEVKKGEVRMTTDQEVYKHYAILSHSVENETDSTQEKIINIHEREEKISRGAYKSLNKAEIVCNHLGIDHLWIDKLCIANNENEIKTEMQNMSKYYGNSTVTLIAIHENLGNPNNLTSRQIIERVVNSRWFSRAWTFQEGCLLSQRTLFMFDDYLIDGTWLAQYWVDNQNTKMVTPLGWVYHKESYSLSDKAHIGSEKALETVMKYREVTVEKDIIYCVLGLSSLGEKIDFKYEFLCKECSEVNKERCSHQDNQRLRTQRNYYWELNEEHKKEKEETSKLVVKLTTSLTNLTAKVQRLEKNNQELKNKVEGINKQIETPSKR